MKYSINTLYDQKLYLNQIDPDLSLPEKEYLTLIIQRNLLSLTGNKNCIVDGLELKLNSFSKNKINFAITPGVGICNLFLFEIYQKQDFEVEINDPTRENSIIVAVELKNYKIDFHVIKANINRQNQILWTETDLDNYFPLRVLKIAKFFHYLIDPFPNRYTLDSPSPDLFYYNYQLSERHPNFDFKLSNNIFKLDNLDIFPRVYYYNNKKLLIPNYTKQINNVYDLLVKILLNEYIIPVLPPVRYDPYWEICNV